MQAGKKLKNLRLRRQITVRDVELASRRIAGVKGDRRFCVSNGWLAQLENGFSEPSICKLFSLSVIYHTCFWDLVRHYDVHVENKDKSRPIANGEECAPNIIYAHVGCSDLTMYPMIRPGAVLKIDTDQTTVLTGEWRNEYERPIFFVELREAYSCGWCELHGNQLTMIPHPSSPATVSRFNFPQEAEIVGRVISYNTRCVDPESEVAE